MNNYEILGVSPNASKAEIKKAYRKMSLIYHPDVGGDEKQFLKIKEAYEILTIDRFDPSKTHCQHVPKSRGFVQFVSSHSDMAGNITHEVFFIDIISAQTDVHKNMRHTWNLEHHHFGANLSVSKKFLLACNYHYKLYFYAKDGSIIVTQQAYKDPRSTIVKLWDKIFN
jgi:hypothetical protein